MINNRNIGVGSGEGADSCGSFSYRLAPAIFSMAELITGVVGPV